MRRGLKASLATALALGGCGLEGTPHAPDADLVSNFIAHRGALERIVAMAEADDCVSRVAPDFVHDGIGPGATLETGRWDEYRRLFGKTGVREGLLKPWWEKDAVLLLCSTQGFVTGGTAKGYLYSRHPPTPVVSSLDDPDAVLGRSPDERAFVDLGEGWYLFFERS